MEVLQCLHQLHLQLVPFEPVILAAFLAARRVYRTICNVQNTVQMAMEHPSVAQREAAVRGIRSAFGLDFSPDYG
jgi:hypothetical protein